MLDHVYLAMIVVFFFFFSSRRRHTRFDCDWSSDVCSSDLASRASAPAACDAAVTTSVMTPPRKMAGWAFGSQDRQRRDPCAGGAAELCKIGRASCRERV